MKLQKVLINNKEFLKSVKSERGKFCVGVNYDKGIYSIINTNEGKTVVTFNEKEWEVFIDSVKKGHFDDLKNN